MNNLQCDSINHEKFFTSINKNWPIRKPYSIVDAVKLLDTIADENFKCTLVKMSDIDLYFNLGLKIRNEWVRHGTDSINNELFYKLKLDNIDYSSGLIIAIFRDYLLNRLELAKTYSKRTNDTYEKEIKKQLMKIQTDLLH